MICSAAAAKRGSVASLKANLEKGALIIFETYARRKKLASGNGEPDVYTYDKAPAQLRHQIVMALSEGIGRFYDYGPYPTGNVHEANQTWRTLDRLCRKEIYSHLKYIEDSNLQLRFCDFLIKEEDIDDFLSAVEFGCRILEYLKEKNPDFRGAEQYSGLSLDEINRRFQQHAIGYQFENGHMLRVRLQSCSYRDN